MKQTLTLVVWVAAVIVLIGIGAHGTRGQAAGAVRMENAKVTQGENMTMEVTLDQAPSLSGSVYVTALPDGATNGGITLNCVIGSSQKACLVGTRVPLDAKLGRWTVSEIGFVPLAGAPKALSKHGDSSFEVIAHGPIVLPDSATVSNIQ